MIAHWKFTLPSAASAGTTLASKSPRGDTVCLGEDRKGSFAQIAALLVKEPEGNSECAPRGGV